MAEGRGGQPGETPSSEDSTVQPPRQATPATPPKEGNSGTDNPVIAGLDPQSNDNSDTLISALGEGDTSLSATFKGLPLTGPVNMTAAEAILSTGYPLVVDFTFPSGATDKKLTLDIAPELYLVSAQGFTINTTNGVINSGFNGSSMGTLGGQIIPDTSGWDSQSASILDGAYTTQAGELTYNFTDGCNSGTIIFYVRMRDEFTMQDAARVISLADIQSSCTESSTPTSSAPINLSFDLTTGFSFTLGNTNNYIAKENGTKTVSLSFYGLIRTILYKQLDFKFELPSQIDINVDNLAVSVGTLSSKSITDEGGKKYLNVSISNVYAAVGAGYTNFITGISGYANNTSVIGSIHPIRFTEVTCTTPDDRTWVQTGTSGPVANFNVTDPNAPNKLKLGNMTPITDWRPTTSDRAFGLLGRATVGPSIDINLTNQHLVLDYPSNTFAVRSISFLNVGTGSTSFFENTVVTVDVDGQGSLQTYTCPAPIAGPKISLDDSNLKEGGGSTATFGANARIVKVEADIPLYTLAAATLCVDSYGAYRPSAVSAETVNYLNIKSYQNGTDPELETANLTYSAASYSVKIINKSEITGARWNSSLGYTTSNGHTNVTGYYPDDNFKVGTYFSIGNSSSFNQATSGYAGLDSFYLYLREIPFTTIDPTSLTSTYGTVTLQPDDITDADGNRVYKYLVEDAKLGYRDPKSFNPSVRTFTQIYFNMSVDRGVVSGTYDWADYIYAMPYWSDEYLDNSFNKPATTLGGTDVAFPSDTLGISGGEFDNVYSVTNGGSLKLMAAPELTGLTTGKTPTEDTWHNYNYKNGAGQLNLSPQDGSGEYRLSLTNNIGHDLNDGFVAYIPIPKQGETAGPTPATVAAYNPNAHIQPEAFEWSATIGSEPVGSVMASKSSPENSFSNFTVSYAPEYSDTANGAAAWDTWSSFEDKDDIRMLKITTTEPMPQGAVFNFSFPLDLPSDAAALNGAVDTWSSQVFLGTSNASGYTYSTPVSFKLLSGPVSGHVLADTDGTQTGTNGVNGITVKLWTRDGGGDNDTLLQTVTTTNGGEFRFDDPAPGLYNITYDIPDSGEYTLGTFGTFDYEHSRFATTSSHAIYAQNAVDNTNTSVSDDLKVYVQPRYTVKFDFNGATSTSTEAAETLYRYPTGTVTKTQYDSVEGTLTAPKGSDFDGWDITGEFTTAGDDYTINGNTTFKAMWDFWKYTVSYDGQGATIQLGPKTQNYLEPNDITVISLPPAPTKIGYDFGGWFTEPLGQGTKFDVGTEVVASIPVYAKWNIKKYKITFTAGTGGSLSGQTVFTGIEHGTSWVSAIGTLPTTVPADSHYSFDKWTAALPSGTFSITGDATYTASFKLDSHSLTYLGNGHTAGEVPSGVTLTHGGKAIIGDANTLAREGYTFLGWAESAEATSATYVGGESLSLTDNMTLYAVWKQNEVIVEPPIDPPATVDDTPKEPPVVNDSTPEPITKTEVVEEPIEPESVNPAAPISPKEAMIAAAGAAGIPLLPGGIPLVAPNGIASWALLDLLLAIAGVVFAIFYIIKASRRRKNEESDLYYEHDRDDEKSVKPLWLATSIILAVISVVIFVLTQDMSLPMVLADVWTIVLAFIFAAELIASKLAFPRKDENEKDSSAVA
ncbi:MAG: InlB B-repeat-containing protein [Clostridiales Family XIII bacterium]|nr:InlB B-repeat-containing protein [Clostridiales Family XIII bacterium]